MTLKFETGVRHTATQPRITLVTDYYGEHNPPPDHHIGVLALKCKITLPRLARKIEKYLDKYNVSKHAIWRYLGYDPSINKIIPALTKNELCKFASISKKEKKIVLTFKKRFVGAVTFIIFRF